MPARPNLGSSHKTKTLEELTKKLSNAMQQHCDPLINEEERKHLFDIVDYCLGHMSNLATQNPIMTGQAATAPNLATAPDPSSTANIVAPTITTMSLNQNPIPSLIPAANPAYQATAPSPIPATARALFQSPTPYYVPVHTESPAYWPTTRIETIFDESNWHPGAVEE